MHRKAIIGLGSNLGDRYDNLQKALQWLERVSGLEPQVESMYCKPLREALQAEEMKGELR